MIPRPSPSVDPLSRSICSADGSVSFFFRRTNNGVHVRWTSMVEQKSTEHAVVFRNRGDFEEFLAIGDLRFKHTVLCLEARRAFDSLMDLEPGPSLPLAELVAVDGFADRALSIISKVPAATEEAEIVEILDEAKAALGVDHAAFVSFIREDDAMESFRFLLACNPAWCIEYRENGWFAHDPWLLYGQDHTEPICASEIPAHTKSQETVATLARKFGIASAYIVPAPSSSSVSRIGILMLGSQHERFFESSAIAPIRFLGRSLAMELHEWWVRRARQEIIENCRLTEDDIELLRYERSGLGSKEIARKMGTTPSAVDSKFQRINAKFRTPTRKATARIAAEYGVI